MVKKKGASYAISLSKTQESAILSRKFEYRIILNTICHLTIYATQALWEKIFHDTFKVKYLDILKVHLVLSKTDEHESGNILLS